jgi:hypothetical protein
LLHRPPCHIIAVQAKKTAVKIMLMYMLSSLAPDGLKP